MRSNLRLDTISNKTPGKKTPGVNTSSWFRVDFQVRPGPGLVERGIFQVSLGLVRPLVLSTSRTARKHGFGDLKWDKQQFLTSWSMSY